MKKILGISIVLASFAFANMAKSDINSDIYNPLLEDNKVVIKMDLLTNSGNKQIGEIIAVESDYGIVFYPNLSGLDSGIHGFHIHQNADCGATDKGLGMKAGGHWDPQNTNNHSFPWNNSGHKGDLPAIYVDKDGNANYPILAPKLNKLDEIKNKALMIHIGGDNHHDKPAALGGGGARMACGVIK
ncbi:MAG: superoxide dismutase family protein [Helicobacteraceae bacterium]|nr:superoxide dismutase family protein [Helicobacteraceae bacterium]